MSGAAFEIINIITYVQKHLFVNDLEFLLNTKTFVWSEKLLQVDVHDHVY